MKPESDFPACLIARASRKTPAVFPYVSLVLSYIGNDSKFQGSPLSAANCADLLAQVGAELAALDRDRSEATLPLALECSDKALPLARERSDGGPALKTVVPAPR